MTHKRVLLHGWGMHPLIWQPLLERLDTAVALPLPGYAGTAPAQNLDEMADQLAFKLDTQTTLIGWSLGGLIAMRMAIRHPEKVGRLVLIGATPCFVNRADWQYGVDETVFEMFAANLAEDYPGTIRRFLALQAQGSDAVKSVLQNLRKQLLALPQPSMAVLESGLSLLRNTDLRQAVCQLDLPITLIHGVGDKLAPVQAARWLQEQMPLATLHEINGAAHAPFLSHLGEVLGVIDAAAI